jgi:hypothetical protein
MLRYSNIFNQHIIFFFISQEYFLGRGWTHSYPRNSSGSYTIDLGSVKTISGFRVLSAFPNQTNYLWREVTITSSSNGSNYAHQESISLPELNDTGVINMSTPYDSRYFRIRVLNFHGSVNNAILIGGIEVYESK